MKFRVPEILIGALLAVAIFGMGMTFSSQFFLARAPHHEATAEGPAQSKSGQAQEAKSLWIPEDATGFFTLWIAAFTGALAISTIALWRSTRDAAIAARDAAEHIPRVERAYMFIGPGKIFVGGGQPNGLGRSTIVELEISYYGATPGFLKRVAYIISDEEPTGSIPRYSEPFVWECDLVVKQDKPFKIPKPVRYEGLESRFLYGFIDYGDIFGAMHTSRFCIKIHSPIGKWEPAGSGVWNSWD